MMTDCSSQPTCTRNQRIRMKNFCKTIVSWFCFSFYVNINSVCPNYDAVLSWSSQNFERPVFSLVSWSCCPILFTCLWLNRYHSWFTFRLLPSPSGRRGASKQCGSGNVTLCQCEGTILMSSTISWRRGAQLSCLPLSTTYSPCSHWSRWLTYCPPTSLESITLASQYSSSQKVAPVWAKAV
jgi:hypothetical protein